MAAELNAVRSRAEAAEAQAGGLQAEVQAARNSAAALQEANTAAETKARSDMKVSRGTQGGSIVKRCLCTLRDIYAVAGTLPDCAFDQAIVNSRFAASLGVLCHAVQICSVGSSGAEHEALNHPPSSHVGGADAQE